MSDTLTLSATLRTEDASGRHASRALRTESRIPAVVYGKGIASRSLTLEYNPFERVFVAAGESSLIDLVVDGGAPIKVLVHDVQRDPLSNQYAHIDFFQVNMNEAITTEVELVFEGVSAALKELGGVFVKNFTHVEITCLPKDLPHSLAVDISILKTFSDHVRVKDIKLPAGVTTVQDPEEIIALVAAPRSEEELATLNSAVVEDVSKVVANADLKKEEKEKSAATEEKK